MRCTSGLEKPELQRTFHFVPSAMQFFLYFFFSWRPSRLGGSSLFFQLQIMNLAIQPIFFKQTVMRADLDDAPMIHHDDLVGAADGA